ncbi:MAG: phage holin family protein [Anaerolineae bacterium]|nr:phage holin family protein [Anaerolineae bacterium]
MTTHTQQSEQSHRTDPRSLGDLFGDLSQKAGLLAQQEIQLAKVELRQKAVAASGEIVVIIAGGFLANAALLALVTAVILGLSQFMAAWLAALVVGVVVGIVGALLVWKGVTALKAMNPMPEQTMITLKEDKEWLTRQMSH